MTREETIQAPSIGRIVHYQTVEGVLPAIVYEVHPDGRVSLSIVGEPGGRYRAAHEVPYDPDSKVGTWRYPPRVDKQLSVTVLD